jgi:isopenicillin-N epimerase
MTSIDPLVARKLVMLPEGKANLNAGTLSPAPRTVFEAVTRYRERMSSNPSNFCWRELPILIQKARSRLATFLNAPIAGLVLVPNATYGLNLVFNSLELPSGSEVLTTDHEYGSMRFLIDRVARVHGWTVREVKLPYRSEDPSEISDAVTREFTDRTRMLFFSHINMTTGLVMPTKTICERAHFRDILSIVDGAHAPGSIPVDITSIRADFYAANCHKWMMAPAGSAFLHCEHSRRAMIKPLVTSWGYGYDPAKMDEMSEGGGTRWQWDLEFHGTTDRCAQCAIPDAIDFLESIGLDQIRARVRHLSDYLESGMRAGGFECATPRNPVLRGPLTAFEFPTDAPAKVRDRMYNEFNIECPVTVAAGKQFLRCSTALFVTEQELDSLVKAAKAIRAAS